MNVNEIKAKFPGYASWNDQASILADFNATGGSGKGPSQPSTPSFSTSLPSTDTFNANQKAESDAFFSALQGKVAGQEKIGDMAGRIGGELGLPALRESAFNLTSTLKNIPTVQGTIAKQVGISAPRLQQRIASESGKLAPVAQEAVSQQQFAEQELGTRLGYGVADQEKELKPFYSAGLPLLQDRLAREETNYQTDKQNELDMIITKMDQGFTATQAELDRANELAMSEKDYLNKVSLLKLGTNEDIRKAQALKAGTGTGISTPAPIKSSTQIQSTPGMTTLFSKAGF